MRTLTPKNLYALCIAALAGLAWSNAGLTRPITFASEVPRDAAVVLVLANADELAQRAPQLSSAEVAAAKRALAAVGFRYGRNDTLNLRGMGPWPQLVVIGAGASAGADGRANAPSGASLPDVPRLQDIGGLARRETSNHDGPVALLTAGLGGGSEAAAQLGVGSALGGYRFERYKSTDPAQPRPAGRDAPFTIVTTDPAGASAAWERLGRPLVDGITFARDLITEPGNVIYPESFVERTREAFRGLRGVTISVLDVSEMQKLGMGAILSVGQGSARAPRMLIIEYRGAGSPERPIVLAGKGVTFDSGGISIKPSAGMWRMKTDMSGAAAVVGTVLAQAKAQTPVHVVAMAGLVENMPDGNATRPGDVVRAFNGRTIEIHNTDAEGRVVLADVVSYAESRFRPRAIVDVATLTGSIVTALGNDYAGLFSRSDALASQLDAAGTATGDRVWRMPLDAAYVELVKSPIADIRDIAESGPGAGIGAHFIGFFVTPQTPWAHLDIAGTAWSSKARPTAPEGAVGFPIRLLNRFLLDFRDVEAGGGGGP